CCASPGTVKLANTDSTAARCFALRPIQCDDMGAFLLVVFVPGRSSQGAMLVSIVAPWECTPGRQCLEAKSSLNERAQQPGRLRVLISRQITMEQALSGCEALPGSPRERDAEMENL